MHYWRLIGEESPSNRWEMVISMKLGTQFLPMKCLAGLWIENSRHEIYSRVFHKPFVIRSRLVSETDRLTSVFPNSHGIMCRILDTLSLSRHSLRFSSWNLFESLRSKLVWIKPCHALSLRLEMLKVDIGEIFGAFGNFFTFWRGVIFSFAINRRRSASLGVWFVLCWPWLWWC